MLDRVIGVRESVLDSKGIFRTGALGHIRFFWPLNHIALEECRVEVVLAVLHESPFLHLLLLLSDAFVHFLVLSANLLARPSWEMRADESEVGSVQLEELFE